MSDPPTMKEYLKPVKEIGKYFDKIGDMLIEEGYADHDIYKNIETTVYTMMNCIDIAEKMEPLHIVAASIIWCGGTTHKNAAVAEMLYEKIVGPMGGVCEQQAMPLVLEFSKFVTAKIKTVEL